MPIPQPSLSPLRRSLHVIAAGWQWLIKAAWDPYRPELHYMRGPGPKWRAAHQQRVERNLL
ncbi:hypothetical protein [Bradyrhizobium sp. STM 3562]|uniref:hypothetical protein n=1 Tax=Bradyrhizobium sp. STM 3562 TaxID=578924 RepID=UPI00388F75A1